jgi:ribosomal protein S18 acetylase RimI-like enzyme
MSIEEALAEPAYAKRVWRVNLHPRDRRGRFRDVLGRFLAKPVASPAGNVLRTRDGLTVSKDFTNAFVLYRGTGREVNLRPEQPDGLYRDLSRDEAVAAIEQAVDEVMDADKAPAIQDTGESSLLNPARFAALYDGYEHNGLKVRVNYARRLKDSSSAGEMDADVLDGDKIVGHIVRNFAKDARDGEPYAYHNEFRLDPEYQDRGFGATLSAHVEAGYRAGDIKHIDLRTDEVGGYAWARAGYEVKSATDYSGKQIPVMKTLVRSRMQEVYRPLYDAALYSRGSDDWGLQAPPGVPPELADHWPAFMAFLGAQARRKPSGAQDDWDFEALPTRIADIARWGADEPVIVNGRQMWLGKWFLVGTSWEGTKRLDEPG